MDLAKGDRMFDWERNHMSTKVKNSKQPTTQPTYIQPGSEGDQIPDNMVRQCNIDYSIDV